MKIDQEYIVVSGEDVASIMPLCDVTDIICAASITTVWANGVEVCGHTIRLFDCLDDAIQFAQTKGETE